MLSRYEEFTTKINLAYKYIMKIKTHEMNNLDLKAAHLNVIFYLGKSSGGLTASELCWLCKEDKAWISKNLNYLKKKKLIEKYNEDKDKTYRAKYYMTNDGMDIYNEIIRIITFISHKSAEGCTKEELDVFYKVFGRIISNLSEFYNRIESRE
ncbi:MAG: hypothetical protein IKZ35_05380 [Clostridia bacterium]|nr:hypothetical protein [Oscillospiraceae bacterium]MBR4893391.1 hypothetical protein [Clostridia bacterium]